MLKRMNWRLIGAVFLWVISLSGLVVLMSFISIKKHEERCTEVKILIPGMQSFIEREEVSRILFNSQGKLVGSLLHQVNIHGMENILKANPFIRNAKVYADMDGVLRVEIQQREPVLRILNAADQDYYVDREGFKIPSSANFTARVLVANGNITERFSGKVDTMETRLLRDLFTVSLFIEQDTLWNDQIEQLYVNKQSEIEMIPRVGDHRIILGNADSIKTKFSNLLAFYKKALPLVGWDAYRTINIKYANQVVCVKNDMDSLRMSAAADSARLAADTLNTTKKLQDTIKTLTP